MCSYTCYLYISTSVFAKRELLHWKQLNHFNFSPRQHSPLLKEASRCAIQRVRNTFYEVYLSRFCFAILSQGGPGCKCAVYKKTFFCVN